jgi:two-component system copper resistance phosphate regulon response regulator CusR
MRILIIEDEELIAKPLKSALVHLGYAVDWEQTGRRGYQAASENEFDCILLDLNLPEMDGIEIAHNLRNDDIQTPIIMVTARHQLPDKLKGFESGADDYISKPFNIKELTARINAVVRRTSENKSLKLTFANYELIPDKNLLIDCQSAQEILLTTKETALLEYLIRNINNTVSTEMLLEHVWDNEINPFTDTVKTHIKTLRLKFDPHKKLLKTIRGKGYMLLSNNEI